MRHPGIGILLATVALLPSTAGCASKKQIQEYQDEIAALREERSQLKKENRELEMQLDDYAVALAEANQKREAPTASAPSYPDLDAVGVDYGQRNGMPYLSIPSEITFPSGKADLTSGGKKALKAVAATLMQEHGTKSFWIEGHTDTDPIKKSSWESNRDLSIARAMAVLHFLVEECGVPDEQCVVAGHGQYDPIAAGSSANDKAKNRRVEIVVHAAGAKP